MPELELRTLGAVDLAGPVDRDPGAVLRAPKRLAVLTYLAIGAPGGFARRDKVLALFWPDQDQERARSALRNLLHLLRRALGDDVILNRGAVRSASRRTPCTSTPSNSSGWRGVFVPAADGTHLGTIVTGGATANVAWGGGGSDLHIAAGSTIYRTRPMTVGNGDE